MRIRRWIKIGNNGIHLMACDRAKHTRKREVGGEEARSGRE